MEAKQTPLIDMLESVPRDAVLVVEHDQFSSSSHHVGRLCHEAAAELRRLQAEIEALRGALKDANDVIFIDGVGAGRSSVKACRDGVQWIMVGDRVYWPLSDSDAKRLHSACCGNGSFDGPTTPTSEGEQQRDEDLLRQALEALKGLYETGAPEGLALTADEIKARFDSARAVITKATGEVK